LKGVSIIRSDGTPDRSEGGGSSRGKDELKLIGGVPPLKEYYTEIVRGLPKKEKPNGKGKKT